MTDIEDGRIVTFYSYKGGTGRTMALANIAWILAANGLRVLVADWDLESPGLHRFLQPFLNIEVADAPGIIDLIREYQRVAARTEGAQRFGGVIRDLARVERYAFSLDWEFPDGGSLDFLSPGKQNRDYVATLSCLDWDSFYADLNGGEFLDALRDDMKRHYDYVLIDSRTGLGDMADICTVHLPDVLIDCFTLSTQGIDGAAQVARSIQQRYRDRGIRILPVPMRVDGKAEKEKVEAGHATAVRLFAGLPAGMTEAQRHDYWAAVEVPYQAFYSFEETLAVFGDPPGSPGSLLASFERITAQITDGMLTSLPPMDEQIRLRTKQLFARQAPPQGDEITLQFYPEDQVWAEWIETVLRDADLTIRERRLDDKAAAELAEQGAGLHPKALVVVSATYLYRRGRQLAHTGSSATAVYVTPTPPLAEFPAGSAIFLAGVPEKDAVERLRRTLGLTSKPASVSGVRYPGDEPAIFNALARNPQFTGREDALLELREQLRDYGTAVVLPVALHGLGGVGKTQVALEYVHRFKTDYDLVWWMDCGQPQFIDASLADLAVHLRERFGVAAPATANVAEAVRVVLDVLSRGTAVPRWLLIYDNAEDIEQVRPLLPRGGGHVLITSRNRTWAESGTRSLPVEVFTRQESVAHLRHRVPSIAPAEADRLARILGDLPLAMATAGAWLAETNQPVADYLAELEREPARTLSISQLADYPVPLANAWDLSLNRLAERSPAAARLFQLCAVMANAIATDLLYSPAMAEMLEPIDPSLSERMIIGRVVQEINRLALIKLDPASGQVIVHPLVRAAVQERMTEEERSVARRDVHAILVAARPRRDVDDPVTWSRYRFIWPHLEPTQAMLSAEEPVRQLLIDRVRYLWLRSDLRYGRRLATEVAAAWQAMQAAEEDTARAAALHKQLLQLQFNLANLLREQGLFEEARELDERVLAEQTAMLGPEHPHTLMTAGSLAADLRADGRYTEALEMDKKTYPSWTELFGENHPRTLVAANNLAVSYRLNGDVTAALRLDADTYERFRATLGPQHIYTLNSARNAARDLLEAGRYAEAAARVEDLARLSAEAVGANSLVTLDAQMVLGIALRSAGRAQEAESVLLAALDRLTSNFGESGGITLACRLSHAANLESLDRFVDAAVEIRDVLATYRQQLGSDHPHTLVSEVNLATALRFTGEHDEAMLVIRRVVQELRTVLGDAHPYALAARMVLGVLLADQGDLDEAERVEASVADDMARTLGPGHPDTLRARANLLLTRQQSGYRGAGAEREAVINQLAALIGADHPNVETLRKERRLMRALDPQPF